MKPRGFSLVEMLIVLAVAGILLAVGSVSLISYQRSLALRQGMTTVVADLNRARSQSRKSSQDWQVVFSSNQSSYLIKRAGQTDESIDLPSGVRIGDVGSTPLSIVYTAPYGLRPQGSSSLSLPLQGPGSRSGRINVVGITGKVVSFAN